MQRQFDKLRASELYCPRCGTARPVRERLLLVLPQGELYEYRCAMCGESLGTREMRMPQTPAVTAGGGAKRPRIHGKPFIGGGDGT